MTHARHTFLERMADNGLPSWWEDIDQDPHWQKDSFLGLSVGYGLIAFVAFIQLIRIQRRVPEYGWTTQKVFHLLNAFVCVLRCMVFALRDQVGCSKITLFSRSRAFWPRLSLELRDACRQEHG